jgi:putative transcriptional regulator
LFHARRRDEENAGNRRRTCGDNAGEIARATACILFWLGSETAREETMNEEHVQRDEVPRQNGVEQPPESLSGVIRYLRQQLGMTQEELAQALGITVGTVSRWEKGRFRPSRLARALIVEFARTHNVPVTVGYGMRNG